MHYNKEPVHHNEDTVQPKRKKKRLLKKNQDVWKWKLRRWDGHIMKGIASYVIRDRELYHKEL